MEVARQCRLRSVSLRANWIPRLQNEEADALTNMEFKDFDPGKRIHVELDQLGFQVLDSLLAEGEKYLSELTSLKEKDAAARKAGGRAADGRAGKKNAGTALRV